MRELTLNEKQWLFTEDTLQNTPSRLDGVSYEDELAKRARAIDLMRSYAVRAQECVSTEATAQSFTADI